VDASETVDISEDPVNTIVRRVLLRLAVAALLSGVTLGFAPAAHAGIRGQCVGVDDSGLGNTYVCTP